MATGASRPWNLSTVPTLPVDAQPPFHGPGDLRHLGVVGSDDDHVQGPERASDTAPIRPRPPDERPMAHRRPRPPRCASDSGTRGQAARSAHPRRRWAHRSAMAWFALAVSGRDGSRRTPQRCTHSRRGASGTSSRGGARCRSEGRAPPAKCSRAEAPTPSGWTPCETCGSWLRIAEQDERCTLDLPTAQTFASESCPASSTNRTSTTSGAFSWAHTQTVPPTTSQRSSRRPASAASVVPMRSIRSSVEPSVRVVIALGESDDRPTSSSFARATASSRLAMTRWLWAVIPTLRPVAIRVVDHPRSCVGLTGTWGALDRRGPRDRESADEATRRLGAVTFSSGEPATGSTSPRSVDGVARASESRRGLEAGPSPEPVTETDGRTDPARAFIAWGPNGGAWMRAPRMGRPHRTV